MNRDEAMTALRTACPSFESRWHAYLSDPCFEADLLYIHLAEFADHLVELLRSGMVDEFPAVFAVVERLHAEGDEYVREAATIGLLESIQNISGNTGIDPDLFRSFLLPRSLAWWTRLNGFWAGHPPVFPRP